MSDDQAREALESERERLYTVRQSVEDGGDVGGGQATAVEDISVADQHPADSATETLDKEVGHALLEQVQSDLDDVDRALAKLEEGSYGKCEACGAPIGDERLAAMPAARYCLTHQQAAEAGGGPSAALGQL